MALSSTQVLDLFQRYVIGNYTRYPVCLTRGEGSYVWDAEGQRYLRICYAKLDDAKRKIEVRPNAAPAPEAANEPVEAPPEDRLL